MKPKTLLEVHIPAIRQTYDVWVSPSLQVKECTELLANTFKELSFGHFQTGNDIVLCDLDSGAIFDASLTVKSLGLKNGSRVMLL